jgi:DMSO reductase anchor subunit
MRPALSVVFLTTLCGAAQGLLLTLVAIEAITRATALGSGVPPMFYVLGAAIAVGLGALGLFASFFHLGHPERAWRAIAMWRTSWLSRECIALPVFLVLAAAYGVAHQFEFGYTLVIGVFGAAASIALFVCTAMIYACLRFLQEWASPLTLVNFMLLGCASGCTLATACAAWLAPTLVGILAPSACGLTLAGGVARLASLARNQRIKPKSSVQSATGIRNGKVEQKSRGFTASAFNTREFFHGRSVDTLRAVKVGFLIAAFAAPLVLVGAGALAPRSLAAAFALALAFVIQYLGLLAERWFFFADARHPQNIYYQRAS